MNRIFNLITITALSIAFNSQALAHSNVEATIPNNNAVLDNMPETIAIHMVKKIHLTKVKMQYENHKALEIDISRHKGFQKEFILPIEAMGAGVYSISWRALGQDGHPIKGVFKFTVVE